MRNIPPLSAVKAFEAAARHENFTRAAAELGMTQAAVSYQIRLLEQKLGLNLFMRDRQRVRLSDAGRRVAPLISGAFDTLADAFSGLVAEDEAVLSISTTQSFASNWIAPRIGSFQLARPELAVRLKTENRLIDFASDDADVGIRSGKGDWAGVRSHFLFRLYSVPMCCPEFLERHKIETPEDVFRVPCISQGDAWWARWLERAGVRQREDPSTSGLWLDSQAIEGNAAMAGQGMAMLSPIFWKNELAIGRLVMPFPILSFDGFSYWLVYPEHKRNQPKIRAFRDWLLAEIDRDAADGPEEFYSGPEVVTSDD